MSQRRRLALQLQVRPLEALCISQLESVGQRKHICTWLASPGLGGSCLGWRGRATAAPVLSGLVPWLSPRRDAWIALHFSQGSHVCL